MRRPIGSIVAGALRERGGSLQIDRPGVFQGVASLGVVIRAGRSFGDGFGA